MEISYGRALWRNFLGQSPDWYKLALIIFLIVNPLVFAVAPFVAGWLLVVEFIFTLAMALKCYPLLPGGLLAIEALLIGQQFGIDPGLMTDVLNASTGMNNSTQKKFKQFVLSRKFNSGFGLDLMVKDLSIALEVARASGVAAPFSNLCRELSASAQALLGPGQDHTALARLSEALAGVELGQE
ncbi:MAG: NAD-binding protein [Bradyrhizobium sp.]|nr:NAD-binding protein [Bradyrhizobium sp.]